MTVREHQVDSRPATPALRGSRTGHRRRLHMAVGLAGSLAGAGIFTAAPAAASPGLTNGSFESPVAPANAFRNLPAGQTIGAWRVTRGSVDHIGAGFWQAADGVQSLDLNGHTTGGITQTFSTRPGIRYDVLFALAGNPGGGPAIKTGTVSADGSVLRTFTFNITGRTFANMGYVTQVARFTATGLTTTLAFDSTSGSAYGPVIDDVAVERSCSCQPGTAR